MKFQTAEIHGFLRILPERQEDARGFFARTYCREEFQRHGLIFVPEQCSTSFNARRGTLRGMHYQIEPKGENKLIRCTRGRIYDVALDLRPSSPSFGKWVAQLLSPENGIQLYIPRGCAHGFLTLEDDSEVEYMMEGSYDPAHGRGVRWNDPAFAIEWPDPPSVIADRDRQWPDFKAHD